MPSLTPASEGAESLSPLAEGTLTAAVLPEGAETLRALVEERPRFAGGTYPCIPVGSTLPGVLPGPDTLPGGNPTGLYPSLLLTYPSIFGFIGALGSQALVPGTLELTPLPEA